MANCTEFYIDGGWCEPVEPAYIDIENPATESACGKLAIGGPGDVDKAVSAAKAAFPLWADSSLQERLALLERIGDEYNKRSLELQAAVTEEMGAPASLAERSQVPLLTTHLKIAIDTLKTFPFRQKNGSSVIVKEPIGVCALITPWNWPLNQIAVKVLPAIATGCCVILKPSEITPLSAHIFAEVMDAAGAPAGVFNLVHGDGKGVGVELSKHPGVDMVSFTGSTRAGIEIARNAAPGIKRVTQELGGKSPNILLDDDSFAEGVSRGVYALMANSGQTCAAPSRMLVPACRLEEAEIIAKKTAAGLAVGNPLSEVNLGPVSSKAQFDKIQRYIQVGIEEGATLVTGGTGRPAGLDKGYFVKPTVFSNVSNDMMIAREEIFGPVLSIIAYETVDDAISMANDNDYGLSAYINAADIDRATDIALKLRAGQVLINNKSDMSAPFGGYKKSGNGREWGVFGFEEYLETKAIIGSGL